MNRECASILRRAAARLLPSASFSFLFLLLAPSASAQVGALGPAHLQRPDAYVVDFVATASNGVAMNDYGDVVGTSYLDVGCGSFCLPPLETVAWRGGSRIVLPTLPGFQGITIRAINGKGWIAGFAGWPSTATHAALWRPVGNGYEITDLGTLPGTNQSEAIGVDDRGRIVGWSTTTNWPPNGSPFLWTQTGGMVDLSTLGFPDEMPLAISPGGTVATATHWYRLDDPNSVTAIASAPSGYYPHGSYPTAINDAGDMGTFLVSTSTQNLVYLFRYHHGGTWQQLSSAPTGHLTTYGIGSIDERGDVTATVQSRGVIAYGPNGLAQDLGALVSPAYPPLPPPDALVTRGGPMNRDGVILAKMMIGRSARLVRLVPAWSCVGSCMHVDDLSIVADFVPDPNDPTQDHCSPDLDAYDDAVVFVTVTDANGVAVQGARLSGHFLDDYWADERVFGTTDATGSAAFHYVGPCGVGAIAFLVDGASHPAFVLDETTGLLSVWQIPQ